jgi:hypothetical protein
MSPSIVGDVVSLEGVDRVRSNLFCLEMGKDFPVSELEVQEKHSHSDLNKDGQTKISCY